MSTVFENQVVPGAGAHQAPELGIPGLSAAASRGKLWWVWLVRRLLPRPSIVKFAIADGFARDEAGADGQWVWLISSSCAYKYTVREGLKQLLALEERVHRVLGDALALAVVLACAGLVLYICARLGGA